MLDRVPQYIDHHQLLPESSRVIVGVSGGVDSMVLLHILQILGYDTIAAHVNYGLRGAASDEDQVLVSRYCNENDIEYHSTVLGEAFREQLSGRSLQEAAREARYHYFVELAHKLGVRYVAVAHHKDDQAETVLQHLMRGTGIEGLAGMLPARPLAPNFQPPGPPDSKTLIRPLLSCTRGDIQAFASEHEIPWREDNSNESDDYERNRVRHHLLPVIREHFGDTAIHNITRSATYLQGYYTHSIAPDLEQRFAVCASKEKGDKSLLIAPLSSQPAVWQARLILEALNRWIQGGRYGATHATAIAGLLEAQVGRKVLMASGTIWRERERLVFRNKEIFRDKEVFRDNASPAIDEDVTLYPGDRYVMADGAITVSTEAYLPATSLDLGPDEILMDVAALTFPLTVRRWQDEDRLKPLGMKGRKKVSDLLTDAKVPSFQRKGILVVLSNEEIVWVAGIRSAEFVKVKPETVRVARLRFEREI